MRRTLTLAMVAAAVSGSAGVASAQMGGMGQASMAPAAGVVNRAVAGFQNLNQSGPGWLYYGINAADRGLGYNGSYMTLGGFIPYAEDDMGGFWAADLRGHLSEYGGFFSNVGFVRKQFLGGTLLGVGVYWDYDGDQNQYPVYGMPGTQFGQFGHSYHQVGISGEWLTDFGNIRSNGYIPVGSTAYTAGNPGSPFYQNYVMCQYGLDSALTGTDLEVGAYIPGLADWAGMISVGGYALGNARYNWNQGSLAGKDVVPWFGGVYTRLDMTFLNNWDFSLQANNDSYFDWTGFARLTYRMGGSRRRNVPDQMEQPMMRNEHIVRAHQTPEVAINPSTGTPWQVVHINNAAAAGGDGTVEHPYNTLAAADTAASAHGLAGNPWTIFLVDRGNGTATGYDTQFSFLAANQSLIGNGSAYFLPTAYCGLINIATDTSGLRPLLSNTAGTSVLLNQAGSTVANFQITGSRLGIEGTGNLTGLPRAGVSPFGPTTQSSYAAGATIVSNVSISGNGTKAPQTGVFLDNASGAAVFNNTSIENMNNTAFAVTGGSANVDYQGSITNDVAKNGGVAAPLIAIDGTTGGTINLATGAAPAGSTVPNQIQDIGGGGIVIQNNSADTAINIDNVTLKNNVEHAITVVNDNSTTTIRALTGSGIEGATNGAILIDGNGQAPIFTYEGPITNSAGYLADVQNTSAGSEVKLYAPIGSQFVDTGLGILASAVDGKLEVIGAQLNGASPTGINVNTSLGTFEFVNVSITNSTLRGVSLTANDDGTTAGDVTFTNLLVDVSQAGSTATGVYADGTGNITFLGGNKIITNNAPAIDFTDINLLNAGTMAVGDSPFLQISTQTTAGGGGAILLNGAGTGVLNAGQNFKVAGGATGTAADITNFGTTITTVP